MKAGPDADTLCHRPRFDNIVNGECVGVRVDVDDRAAAVGHVPHTRDVLTLAWYRTRATFRRRWPGYLTVVALVGLVGGVAMASIAGARLTQSSYPTFLASTNPSDMNVAIYNPDTGGGPGPTLTNLLSHLPGVKRVRAVAAPTIAPLAKNGSPDLGILNDLGIGGSVDGEYFHQDRLTVVQGRMANPNRANEMVMDATAARLLDVHVGQIVTLGLYTDAQTNLPGFGTPSVRPILRVPVKVVGIAVANNGVVEDDIDRAYGTAVVTPAFLRRAIGVSPTAGAPELYALQLDHGGRNVPAVEQEVISHLPRGLTNEFHVTSRVVTEVELAVKPEAIALGGFGAIAAAVALVLGIQAISRQVRVGGEERQVLRALGASPATTAADGLVAILFAVLIGSLVAVGLAVGLSPLFPLGPVRPVYPNHGISLDWTVLGIGFAVLVIGLGAAAIALSYRTMPNRAGARAGAETTRTSRVIRGAEATGMSVSGVLGLHFALGTGRGGRSVPVRSALLGTVLAVVIVVAAFTFASGLSTLLSSPPLYGWNWNYALNPSNDVPPQSLTLLSHDSDVAAWSGFDYNDFEVDGQTVPVLFGRPHAQATPPILSGHGLDANNQIVMGAATLAVLHKHVGDTVLLSYGTAANAPTYLPPTPLVIVGTATFPAVGYASSVADHTSMGTGALFSAGIFPPTFQRAVNSRDPILNGPELVFVRLRSGVSAATGRVNLEHIAKAADKVFAADPNADGDTVAVIGVQRPAQIVNYRTIGSTPIILAVGIAVGAIVALAITLIASVRHRRRDLAVLKVLGFTPRQLSALVAWQSTVAALVGIIVGVPCGIILGRQLWTAFARGINAVPDSTIPVVSVILVAIGALIFANLIAAIPGRLAARTPTALVLRAE